MNGKSIKYLRKKAVENVREKWGTVTATLCEQEYQRLKKIYKNHKAGK
jgi:hypothetical protein